jgi:Holliday junction DNA helicase RuvA
MIVRITGKIIEKKPQSIILENNGFSYEIFMPVITLSRIEENLTEDGHVKLITYHYHQVEPSRSIPVLIGFLNEIEKEFFEVFITVSGIGPKAALRALNMPISEIAAAINDADIDFLRTLPGIGPQRAKEIIAKLQGKIGRFGLLQDSTAKAPKAEQKGLIDEAIEVLAQLQYKKNEAKEMVNLALKKQPHIKDVEELLNIVYKQKVDHGRNIRA